MNEQDKRLIHKLKTLKEKMGVTYTHIARELGVSGSAINNYSRGMTWVLGNDKKEELKKIIDRYGIDLDDRGDYSG